MCVCLEQYPREWLLELFNDLMDPHQFGSLKRSSTDMALAELVHGWLTAFEKPGTVIRVLFLDLKKAFNRVKHHILLSKLKEHDVPEFLVNWIASVLCDRKQHVKVGEKISDWCHIKARVPQGTRHGPITFLIHINDLQAVVNGVKYVDDSSLWEA